MKRTCPSCLEEHDLEEYKIYPEKHFGRTHLVTLVCKDCIEGLKDFIKNTELEILHEESQLPDYFYVELLFKYIRVKNAKQRKKKNRTSK